MLTWKNAHVLIFSKKHNQIPMTKTMTSFGNALIYR